MKFNRGLHWFASFTALSTLLLIVAGSLVTSHDAGLSVPDWPLSFGQVMPEMVGGVFYEHGHRMIASGVGLLTIILAVWLSRVEPRRWVRRLGWFALAAVVFQGLLGGMTVLFRLPVAISVFHACLAQTYFCVMVSLAIFTSKSWAKRSRIGLGWHDPSFRLAVSTFAALYLQLVLGAILRHAGTIAGSKAVELAPGALLAHLLGALLATVCVIRLSIQLIKADRHEWGAYGLLTLLLVQLSLGGGSLLARLGQLGPAGVPLRVGITSGHVAVGATLLAFTLWLTLSLGAAREAQRATLSDGWLGGTP